VNVDLQPVDVGVSASRGDVVRSPDVALADGGPIDEIHS
jgi:hypothetical protein